MFLKAKINIVWSLEQTFPLNSSLFIFLGNNLFISLKPTCCIWLAVNWHLVFIWSLCFVLAIIPVVSFPWLLPRGLFLSYSSSKMPKQVHCLVCLLWLSFHVIIHLVNSFTQQSILQRNESFCTNEKCMYMICTVTFLSLYFVYLTICLRHINLQ